MKAGTRRARSRLSRSLSGGLGRGGVVQRCGYRLLHAPLLALLLADGEGRTAAFHAVQGLDDAQGAGVLRLLLHGLARRALVPPPVVQAAPGIGPCAAP